MRVKTKFGEHQEDLPSNSRKEDGAAAAGKERNPRRETNYHFDKQFEKTIKQTSFFKKIAVFSLFNIVQFQNDPCQSTETITG